MNHSLDLSALEQYSQTFSEEVAREVYARQSRVSRPRYSFSDPGEAGKPLCYQSPVRSVAARN